MRKFALISLALLLFTTPAHSADGDAQLLAHNVTRLSTVLESFNNLDSPNLNNHNSRISLAMKIGQLREVTKSGQEIGSDELQDTKLFRIYSKALESFSKATHDLENAIRRTDKKSISKAQEHVLNGVKYLKFIKKGL